MPPRPRARASGRALPVAILLTVVVAGFSILSRPTATHVPALTAPGHDVAVGGTPPWSIEPPESAFDTTSPHVGSPTDGNPPTSSATSPAKPASQPNAISATPKPTPEPTPRSTPRSTASPTKPPSTPKPPTGLHLTLGAWTGQPWEPSKLNSFTSLVGGTPGVFLTFLGWPDRADAVAADEKVIADLGASHVMTWVPFGMTLKSIANGDQDAYVRQYAKGAAAWGKRYYIRLMQEMNGDWFPWGRGVNGNTASDFVHAWRHVVDIFEQEGATNVKWVWCPNVRYGSNYPFADLYPGSSYVDWVCLDGYNWGSDPHLGQPAWQSFGSIFGSTYNQLTNLAPGKPMMIGETASTENGGNKASWILKTFLQDVPDYPAIKSVIWFNDPDGPSDFRVNSSPESLDAFRQVVSSSLWNATLP
jgi:hypothetical protein